MSSADIEMRRGFRSRIQDRFHLGQFDAHEFNVRRQSRCRHLCGIHLISDEGIDADQRGLDVFLVSVDIIGHNFELLATIGDDLVGYRDGLSMKSEISFDSIQSVIDILEALLEVCGVLWPERRLRRPIVGRVVARSLTSARTTTLNATMTSSTLSESRSAISTISSCGTRPATLQHLNHTSDISSSVH
jgi:hypothetical protein